MIFLYSGIKLNREHFRPSIFFEESSRIITSFKTQLQIQANPSRFNFLSHVIRLFCQRHLRCFHSSILKYFFNYRGSNFLTNVTDTLTNLPCTPKTTTFIRFLFFVLWTSLLILEHFYYVFGFHVLNEFSATFNTFKAIQPNALFLRVEFIPLIYPYLFTNYNLGLSSTPLFGFIHVLIIVEGY